MDKPWIVLGGGGHAMVVIDALLSRGCEVLGFTSPDSQVTSILGVEHIGDDAVLDRYAPDAVALANGIGSVKSTDRRRELFIRFSEAYTFLPVIHASAVVAPSVAMEAGAQVMAGAIIQPGSRIMENSIINTRSSVDHDCSIGAHVHIAPGVTLSGGVTVGAGAHIGTGSSVIQGMTIGAGSVVGAGAVVICDVPPGVTVVGVPAKERDL